MGYSFVSNEKSSICTSELLQRLHRALEISLCEQIGGCNSSASGTQQDYDIKCRLERECGGRTGLELREIHCAISREQRFSVTHRCMLSLLGDSLLSFPVLEASGSVGAKRRAETDPVYESPQSLLSM